MSPAERRARIASLLAESAREGQADAADLDAYVLGFTR